MYTDGSALLGEGDETLRRVNTITVSTMQSETVNLPG